MVQSDKVIIRPMGRRCGPPGGGLQIETQQIQIQKIYKIVIPIRVYYLRLVLPPPPPPPPPRLSPAEGP